MTYSAYILTEESRQHLLNTYGARHADIIAHHITYRFGSADLPPEATRARVWAYAKDEYAEAVAVEVFGQGTTRPDGNAYHITLSVNRDAGGKPFHSNRLLQKQREYVEPIILTIYGSVEN